MDVLVCLAAEPGKVVRKEELLSAVWGGIHVEEGVLSQAVHGLRKALGDDARRPRYIQTIPKRGYLLLAPVVPEEAEAEPVAELPPDPSPLEPAPGPSGAPPPVPLRRSRWIPVLLAAAVLFAVLWLTRGGLNGKLQPEPQAVVPAPSNAGMRIVVLPFENLGKPEDDYFADGLTEEITKDLASFPSLQVISRTTALLYKGGKKPLREIGRELGVNYVLEGTVRWAPGPEGKSRVRITPQLIRVEDDTHVWAGAYDREVGDIFLVQAEISRRVIGELGITLMPEQQRRPRQPPTENLEAYRAYLRGLELRNQPFYSEEHIRQSVPMFERAVHLAPDFAAAWAELSQTESYLAFNSDPSPEQVERARYPLERALALDPDLPEVILAQAYFSYRCLRDYAAAETQLAAASRLSPNNADVFQTLGYVLRRRGRMVEALDKLERAFSLDPRTVRLLWAAAETHRALRQFESADRYYVQATSMAPDQVAYWEDRALNWLDWTGDLDRAREILEESPVRDHPKLASAYFLLDFYGRDYKSALGRLTPEARKVIAPQLESYIVALSVIARERLGDHDGARSEAEANRAILEARVARYPMDPFYRANLSISLVQLGREEEGRTHLGKALQMVSHDAFSGPRIVEIQALVDSLLGERRAAVNRLSRLLAMPYQGSISVNELRLSPAWDPLREDPGFMALLRDDLR